MNDNRKQRVHITGGTCQVVKMKRFALKFTEKPSEVTCVTCLKSMGMELNHVSRYRAKLHYKSAPCGRRQGNKSDETDDVNKVTCTLCIKKLMDLGKVISETEKVRQALMSAGYIQ